MARADDVVCPCGYTFDTYEIEDLITYWGSAFESGAVELVCHQCQQVLLVTEHVSRTYEIVEAARATG